MLNPVRLRYSMKKNKITYDQIYEAVREADSHYYNDAAGHNLVLIAISQAIVKLLKKKTSLTIESEK